MFPFQPTHHELGFGTPTTSQSGLIQENNLISFSIGTNDREVTKRKDLELCGKRKKESSSHGSSSSSRKKVMRREVERKRRQEMSDLYASLRTLLPQHRIEGKSSVCDQIEEAASHIKEMEKNIEELKSRKNKLKSWLDSSGGKVESSNGRDRVTINLVSDGIEIVISDSSQRCDLGLSRVLAELQRRELDVISSVSTRIKDRFLHKIEVKARDISCLDVLMLRDGLNEAVKFTSSAGDKLR